MTRTREIALSGWLILLGLSLAIGLIEIFGRLFPAMLPSKVQIATGLVEQTDLGNFNRTHATMFSPDPYLGVKLKPDVNVFLEGHPDFSFQVKTTSFGFEDIGFRMASDENTQLPVFGVAVGDSFTFGTGVNAEDGYVRVLSELSGLYFVNTMSFAQLMPSAFLT